MPSKTYIRIKSQEASDRNSKRGKISAKRAREKRQAQASELVVTGTMKTTGVFGEHFIELLADEHDPLHCWMRVDGEIRKPRTCAGVRRVVSDWIWTKGNK